jgi:hypothetical protein
MPRFSDIVPKTPLELEIFYLDVIKKLQGTNSTLADEDMKSIVPVFSLINTANRRIDHLEKSINTHKAQIARLEKRLLVLEKELS